MIIHFPEDQGTIFERFFYPAGEQQVRLKDDAIHKVQGCHRVKIVARLANGDDFMGLTLLADALAERGVEQPRLVLPYLPYSRADRRFVDGDCFGLKMFSRAIGHLVDPYSVTTFDAHSPISEKMFSRYTYFSDVSPRKMIELVQNTMLDHSPVGILLPDKGAARYGIEAPTCEKIRDPKTGRLSGFTVPSLDSFADKESILIIDDICDGGGTFIGIAEELRKAGWKKPLFLWVSHGIFSKGTSELLRHFQHIFTTNSFTKEFPGVTRLDVISQLVAEAN